MDLKINIMNKIKIFAIKYICRKQLYKIFNLKNYSEFKSSFIC